MRSAYVERKTKETDIKLKLNLDGGDIKIDTGIGFFDHMLNSFATHGRFGLEVSVKGDLCVDEHHTVDFPQARCGGYDCSMTVEFMRAFAFNAQITLHLKSVYGDNSHHITEALYKACAHALRLAVKQNSSNVLLSTKGVL